MSLHSRAGDVGGGDPGKVGYQRVGRTMVRRMRSTLGRYADANGDKNPDDRGITTLAQLLPRERRDTGAKSAEGERVKP